MAQSKHPLVTNAWRRPLCSVATRVGNRPNKPVASYYGCINFGILIRIFKIILGTSFYIYFWPWHSLALWLEQQLILNIMVQYQINGAYAHVNIMPHYPLYRHRCGKIGDCWGNWLLDLVLGVGLLIFITLWATWYKPENSLNTLK